MVDNNQERDHSTLQCLRVIPPPVVNWFINVRRKSTPMGSIKKKRKAKIAKHKRRKRMKLNRHKKRLRYKS